MECPGKYVIHHLWKTVILVSAITLILFLPPALILLFERGAENLDRLRGKLETLEYLLNLHDDPLPSGRGSKTAQLMTAILRKLARRGIRELSIREPTLI